MLRVHSLWMTPKGRYNDSRPSPSPHPKPYFSKPTRFFCKNTFPSLNVSPFWGDGRGCDSHAYVNHYLLNSRQTFAHGEYLTGTYQLICFGCFLLPGLRRLKYIKERSGGLNDTAF